MTNTMLCKEKHVANNDKIYHAACQAMNGMLAHHRPYHPRAQDMDTLNNPNMTWHIALAREAFDIAEAMAEEAEKRGYNNA